MASPLEIANDLLAQAATLDGRHVQGSMMHGVCRSLRRGAAEIERLEAELIYYRSFAEAALAEGGEAA